MGAFPAALVCPLLSYDDARKLDQKVDSRMLLAKNAALGAHTHILEDGPEPPKAPTFSAGIQLGPGQCSHLFWRNLTETFTTPRLMQPMVGAGT
jgi:hypothetical protein